MSMDPIFSNWDPTSVTATEMVPRSSAIKRVKRELMNLFLEPPPGLFVVSDERDIMLIHAIIVGPMETPYEGGFFYFLVRCTNNYPIEPPLVKLMTTDAGQVRFSPNLYKNGKICLSILGTWTGPAWTPAQQLSSLLVSIQSLMSDKPYFNEPGVVSEIRPGDAKCYSEIIQHETLRVAVCGMLENDCHLNIPESLRKIMEKNFLAFYEQHVSNAESLLNMDGKQMRDPLYREHSSVQSYFNYARILVRLKRLKDKLSAIWTQIDTQNINAQENNDNDDHDESEE